MPFLRLTRDQRGYENTFLLHAPHPGERPRVLYWYRSAPGVRVGRPPLDEDAIRAIEDRHPDIEFDWPHILEAGTMLPPEVDERPERSRRRPPRPREEAPPPASVSRSEPPTVELRAVNEIAPVLESAPPALPAQSGGRDVLQELVGREIATRLRARYVEIATGIRHAPDAPTGERWHARASALDPDRWTTPAEILRGIERADALFDELRREIGLTRPAVSSDD